MEKSLWHNEIKLPSFHSLKGDIKTDVLIVGGGLCGLLCAYYLKKAGIDCIVAESNKIASGTSGNTTAKITSLHGAIYGDLIEKSGIETAQKYFDINQQAIKEYEKIAKSADCDFKESTAYTYSLNDSEKIEKEYNALLKLGAPIKPDSKISLPFKVSAIVGLQGQAEFNPLKFIKYIAEGLDIYENTRILEVNDNVAYYSGGKIMAEKIIIATHFPFINKHGFYFLKQYQYRSYVIALENAPNVGGMYVDEADGGLSFRNYGNFLLLGGCGARTGKPCGNWTKLTEYKEKYYPNSKEKYRWATQDCMSLDKIPFIGKYSAKKPDLLVATGFNKWGMTSSMVSAMILTDMIKGTKNEYADIFDPSRTILKPQLAINCFETLANYIIPTTKRCPHLGCALKWNKYERSWDCSCHGSRFEKQGKLINNPANKDMK